MIAKLSRPPLAFARTYHRAIDRVLFVPHDARQHAAPLQPLDASGVRVLDQRTVIAVQRDSRFGFWEDTDATEVREGVFLSESPGAPVGRT